MGFRERVVRQIEDVSLVVVGNEGGIDRQIPEGPDRHPYRHALRRVVDIETPVRVGPHRIPPTYEHLRVHYDEVAHGVAHAPIEVERPGFDDDGIERYRGRLQRQLHGHVHFSGHRDRPAERRIAERIDAQRIVACCHAPEAEPALGVGERGAVSLKGHDRVLDAHVRVRFGLCPGRSGKGREQPQRSDHPAGPQYSASRQVAHLCHGCQPPRSEPTSGSG